MADLPDRIVVVRVVRLDETVLLQQLVLVVTASASAALAEARARASASHRALSGTAAPPERARGATQSQECQPREASVARCGATKRALSTGWRGVGARAVADSNLAARGHRLRKYHGEGVSEILVGCLDASLVQQGACCSLRCLWLQPLVHVAAISGACGCSLGACLRRVVVAQVDNGADDVSAQVVTHQ